MERTFRLEMREYREWIRQKNIAKQSEVQTQERNQRAKMREKRARNRRIALVKDAARQLQAARQAERILQLQ